ncbi:MAG: type transport system permease protein [Solirubrobacteraceae bacterium]|jgi:ABC-2 type transport system permease protein|nr:type transport system permease protein [Solirubrobacteraceae bacterium]
MSVQGFDEALLGPPIAGPSALGGGFRRFFLLARTLAVTDFKLRFFGSVLGYFWQLGRPLMLFGVLYAVFTQFLRLGTQVNHYPIVLLSNIVLFTFFAEATGGAVASVVGRENLVRKIQFPRMAIPVSVVITASFNLALNTIVVLVFALANGVHPRWSWFEVPLLVCLLALLIVGIAMLLSALFVRFRDVAPIWDVVVQALFYATPVIYVIDSVSVSANIKHAIMLNPIAAILAQFRHAVIDPAAPTAAAAVGGTWRLLIPLGIIVFFVVVGYRVFNRDAPHIAENL